MLTEMRDMRRDLNASLDSIEGSVKDVNEGTNGLERRMDEQETRQNDTKDRRDRSDRLLGYILKKQRKLEEKCDKCEMQTNSVQSMGYKRLTV